MEGKENNKQEKRNWDVSLEEEKMKDSKMKRKTRGEGGRDGGIGEGRWMWREGEQCKRKTNWGVSSGREDEG